MFSLALAACLAFANLPCVEDGVLVRPNIAYTEAETAADPVALHLDLYMPAKGCGAPCPTLIGVHGGAFRAGSPKDPWFSNLAHEMAARGFAVAMIEYRKIATSPRLRPETEDDVFEFALPDLPTAARLWSREDRARARLAAIEDLHSAMAWVAKEGERYGLDARAVGLWGHSAGAITSLNLSHGADDLGLPMDGLPQIAGVAAYQGRLLPDFHPAPGDAPVMIVHGTEDRVVPYVDALSTRERILDADVPVWFFPLDRYGHSLNMSDPERTQVAGSSLLDHTETFFRSALSGLPSASNCLADTFICPE